MGLTVGQLIDALAELPDDLEVVLEFAEMPFSINSARVRTIAIVQDGFDEDAEYIVEYPRTDAPRALRLPAVVLGASDGCDSLDDVLSV